MPLPEVYLIGAPKAGTTSLARWMASRPDIYFSSLKEPVFWASDYPRLRQLRGYDSRAAYEQLFSSSEARRARVRAEGSTVYLYSRQAVPDIVQAVPTARFIVAVRNPVELVLSFHRTQRLLLNENEPDFAAAWRRNLEGRPPAPGALDAKLLDYAMVGKQGEAVARVLDVVPRDRMHFIVFDNLVRDPAATWSALTGFLGVGAEPYPDFAVHNQSSRNFRFKRLQQLKERPPPMLRRMMRQVAAWSRSSRNPLVRKIKHRFWWRPERKPEISPELQAELAAYFAADVRKLSAVLGTDLSGWTKKYRRSGDHINDVNRTRSLGQVG